MMRLFVYVYVCMCVMCGCARAVCTRESIVVFALFFRFGNGEKQRNRETEKQRNRETEKQRNGEKQRDRDTVGTH
jgi:hypothetical protein